MNNLPEPLAPTQTVRVILQSIEPMYLWFIAFMEIDLKRIIIVVEGGRMMH
jgi:hypothetical protein